MYACFSVDLAKNCDGVYRPFAFIVGASMLLLALLVFSLRAGVREPRLAVSGSKRRNYPA